MVRFRETTLIYNVFSSKMCTYRIKLVFTHTRYFI